VLIVAFAQRKMREPGKNTCGDLLGTVYSTYAGGDMSRLLFCSVAMTALFVSGMGPSGCRYGKGAAARHDSALHESLI
jgi:hypothetical protein